MLDKTLSASAVVAALRDGMTIGIGGWGPRRKPMALVREMLRSTSRTSPSLPTAARRSACCARPARCADSTTASSPWMRSRWSPGSAARARRAASRRTSWTRACCSGACAPRRCACRSCRRAWAWPRDVLKVNPEFRTVQSPYADGEVLLAMPALNLDAALIHVDRADRLGNVQTLGPDPYFDEQFARAAARTYVSCEELSERLDLDTAPMRAATSSSAATSAAWCRHALARIRPPIRPPTAGTWST